MSTDHALPAGPLSSPADRVAQRAETDRRADRFFRYLVTGAGLFVLVALTGAALSMLWGGRLAFSTFGIEFLTTTDWDAVGKKFGALVPIYGTLVTALIAMLIAVPVSFGIALFLTEVAPPWLRTPVALPSNCSPVFRRSSTACGAFSCSCRSCRRPSFRS